MGARRPNARLAKIHHSYSVEEMAELFNVHNRQAEIIRAMS
jgi:hypothetical protein